MCVTDLGRGGVGAAGLGTVTPMMLLLLLLEVVLVLVVLVVLEVPGGSAGLEMTQCERREPLDPGITHLICREQRKEGQRHMAAPPG